MTTIPFKLRICLFPALGLAAGGVLSIWAAAVYSAASAVRAATPSPAIGPLVTVYLLAGTLGGILLALTFPLVRWLGGAFIVGAAAIFPMYFGMSIIHGHTSASDHALWAAIAALTVGGTAGAREWLGDHRTPRTLAQVWIFAAACSVIAWIVGLHWAGEWPAAVAVFVFLVPVMLALVVTLDRPTLGG